MQPRVLPLGNLPGVALAPYLGGSNVRGISACKTHGNCLCEANLEEPLPQLVGPEVPQLCGSALQFQSAKSALFIACHIRSHVLVDPG
jgi:hypothetical protein